MKNDKHWPGEISEAPDGYVPPARAVTPDSPEMVLLKKIADKLGVEY